jgi:phage shock protein A
MPIEQVPNNSGSQEKQSYTAEEAVTMIERLKAQLSAWGEELTKDPSQKDRLEFMIRRTKARIEEIFNNSEPLKDLNFVPKVTVEPASVAPHSALEDSYDFGSDPDAAKAEKKRDQLQAQLEAQRKVG